MTHKFLHSNCPHINLGFINITWQIMIGDTHTDTLMHFWFKSSTSVLITIDNGHNSLGPQNLGYAAISGLPPLPLYTPRALLPVMAVSPLAWEIYDNDNDHNLFGKGFIALTWAGSEDNMRALTHWPFSIGHKSAEPNPWWLLGCDSPAVHL